ncbi:hypothetical protein QFC19_007410 [Naganishia cerealis]|uniref:Uncharacterized protein n=1 Tax=Naganishia cerealis TaxID=610337 RepID=A0ACC2V9P9_9TREE|nr:hypothetical protein QFC19_007410 [Naganishia cerealis]
MPNPSIVDKLVRAAAAVPTDIPDEQLNRHVADLLAKEAKEKEAKWREMGIGVYLPDKPGSSSRAPKPNTRFLKSIVRDVDGHNTALLRQQAEAAKAAALDKFYTDSKPRDERDRGRGNGNSSRARTDGDSDVARMKRLFGGAVGSATSSRSRSDIRSDHSANAKSGGAAGSWRRDAAGQSGRRHRHDDDRDENSDDEERGWSRRNVGTRKPRSALHRAEEEAELEDQRRERTRDSKRPEGRKAVSEKEKVPLPTSKRHAIDPALNSPPTSSSAAINIPSKMDRYFEPTYDPKKDYRAMLDAQETAVPRTGLVPDVDIGWDSMLSTIKYRGQEKDRARDRLREEERKRERDSEARHKRETVRDREYSVSRSSRDKKRSSTSRRSRREERSPSIISIRDSSDEASSSWSDSESDSDSNASHSPERHRKKRTHHSRSTKKHRDEKDGNRSKKSSTSRSHKSGRRRSGEKRRRSYSDGSESDRERKKVHVGGYEYVTKGAVREWDRGKQDAADMR